MAITGDPIERGITDLSERVYQDQLQTCLQLRVGGLKLSHTEKVKRAHQLRSKGTMDKHKVRPTNQKDKEVKLYKTCGLYLHTLYILCYMYIYCQTRQNYHSSYLSITIVCSSSARSTDCCRLVYARYPFMCTH